jgi:hypothetical protein
LKALALYLELGLGWATWFHLWGLRRMDPGVEGAGFFFRLMITPGLIVLWPLMAARGLALARGREFLGGTQSPVTSGGLRAIHFRLIQVFVPCLPLLIGLALALRPAPVPSLVESPPGAPARLPEPASSSVQFTPEVPLAVTVEWSGMGAPRLSLRHLPGSESEDLLLFWASRAADVEPSGATLLGSLPRGGEAHYSLPAEAAHGDGRLFVYALERGKILAIATVPRRQIAQLPRPAPETH